jgi:organic radical activating enzyme
MVNLQKRIIRSRPESGASRNLEIDSRWYIVDAPRKRTLQYFITSRCDQRCKDCFFREYLGSAEVSLDEYKSVVGARQQEDGVQKVNLLGGEPTSHPDIERMLRYNDALGLATHIYTNGSGFEHIPADIPSVVARVSVLSYRREKAVTRLPAGRALTIVYPLRPDNIADLEKVVRHCESLDVRAFVFSSIKRLETASDFFEEKQGCLTADQYLSTLSDFFSRYRGSIDEFHINARGILDVGYREEACGFVNRLADGRECNCPFDIDVRNVKFQHATYGKSCPRSDTCLLQKVILRQR